MALQLLDAVAAVGNERLAGDVRRLVTGEERDNRRDLSRRASSSDWRVVAANRIVDGREPAQCAVQE